MGILPTCMCMSGAQGGQKRESDSLDLKLHTIVNYQREF